MNMNNIIDEAILANVNGGSGDEVPKSATDGFISGAKWVGEKIADGFEYLIKGHDWVTFRY